MPRHQVWREEKATQVEKKCASGGSNKPLASSHSNVHCSKGWANGLSPENSSQQQSTFCRQHFTDKNHASRGFEHFGEVRGDFAVLKGSIPGPPKRFVDLRLPLNPRKGKIKEPRIIELNIAGQTIRQLVAVPIYQEQKAKT